MSRRVTIALCGALLLVFAALSYAAVASKSPTYDEPLHAVGAWLHLHDGDFRVNPEDPPLWHYWMALPNGRGALRADTAAKMYADVIDDVTTQWYFVVETLYRTEGNVEASSAFFARSRFMMMLLGVALGGVVATWAWQLRGGVAAVTAALLLALDPNFLAHAPLLKNDVALSLVAGSLAWAAWRAGRRLTPWNALALCLLCAAAVTVKFSGLLFGPIVALLLLGRALLPAPWPVLRRLLATRPQKLAASAALCVAAAIVSYAGIWAAYGFRFSATPDPNVRLNVAKLMEYTAANDLTRRSGQAPTTQQVREWQPTAPPRAIESLMARRALPEAWLFGLLYTYQSTLTRETFLLGRHSLTGWWYYFPVAMLVKSPIALLLASLAAAGVGIFARGVKLSGDVGNAMSGDPHRSPHAASQAVSREPPQHAPPWSPSRDAVRCAPRGWTALCLLIPPVVYLAFAMASNLNLGLRHVLPVYPFIFVAIGVAAARLWRARPLAAKRGIVALGLVLAGEAIATFPNYIAFFNVAAGGARGGLRLLGDSNLDWGQDLTLVARWQQEHPQVPLYLAYFGTADPWAYGIDYVNFNEMYRFGPVDQPAGRGPGVLAVSATHLQTVYGEQRTRELFAHIRRQPPIEVLGGTIYLYRYPQAVRR